MRHDPAPAGAPLSRSVTCEADADVAVVFELTLARAAHQGFFDVAVTFADIFCSAKLDCVWAGEAGDEPLELSTNPLSVYWDVALGPNEAALATASECRLQARGTATDGPLVGGATVGGARWPYVAWDVNLTDAGGAVICGSHAVNGGDVVAIVYSPTGGVDLAASFASGPGLVTSNVVRLL